jgi:NAD(P)-dependent dehydrogenase (short-subunit alcohol dehydrogenase family)
LVTGGSRGIGAAVARLFAAKGDRVAVHYRSAQAAAEATLASLPEDGHVLVAADLLDAERSAILGLRSSTRCRKTYQP